MSISAPVLPTSRVRAAALTNHALIVGITVLLLAPSVLFATALQPLPAAAVLIGCAGTLALVVFAPADTAPVAAPIATRRLALCFTGATAVLLLGGETHLFYPTWDWTVRDAVLADLVEHGFPLGYRVGADSFLLRAPLGMYLLPALVGRAGGLFAAHAALLAQNAAILSAIFYFILTLGSGWRTLLIALVFGGLSLVGAPLRVLSEHAATAPYWLQWGLDAWHPFFQYSSTAVQFFWVPNHALPGWWLAVLLLLQVRGQVDIAIVGASMAAAVLWSPLSVIPVLPWLLLCAVRSPRSVLTVRTIAGAVSAAGFIPIVAFLVLGAASIGGGSPLDTPDFPAWYAVFVVLALPALPYLAITRPSIAQSDRILVLFSAATLLVLPFFRFGPNNDLVMRGSIAVLAIIAFSLGDVVSKLSAQRAPIAIAGWLLVAACTPSAIVEIGRALATPRYAISDCSVMEATAALGNRGLPTNYIVDASAVPRWLIDTQTMPVLSQHEKACWPDRVGPRFPGR